MSDHPIIAAEGLGRTYLTGAEPVQALIDVSFTVPRGAFVAIMGPSGSGKSTLMNLLGCLDRPDQGAYRLDGEDTARASPDRLAWLRNHRIGFVFQSFNLLARSSALENVALPLMYRGVPAAERPELAHSALQRVGLANRADHRPNQLSGGQQQRVAIARALVGGPALLLADEPTGALDSRTGLEIMALFQQLNAEGNTVVIVTHDADVAGFAGRVLKMGDGRLVSDQPVASPVSAAQRLAAA